MVTADTTQTFFGLSTDTKPTNASNGAMFIEIDTGVVNCYDAGGESWEEWFALKEE